jgi:hypothetical protein
VNFHLWERWTLLYISFSKIFSWENHLSYLWRKPSQEQVATHAQSQWLLQHLTPSTRRTVKVTAGEVETVLARKSHDDGSSKYLHRFRFITLSSTIYIHTSHSNSEISLELFFKLENRA